MEQYFVNNNAQSNGDHEVHTGSCRYCPTLNRTFLGNFGNCKDAVIAAKRYYTKADGCATCCPACHKS